MPVISNRFVNIDKESFDAKFIVRVRDFDKRKHVNSDPRSDINFRAELPYFLFCEIEQRMFSLNDNLFTFSYTMQINMF